jgi:hypothetical protein
VIFLFYSVPVGDFDFWCFISVSDGDYVLICSTVSVGDYRIVWCFLSVSDGDYVLICSTVSVGD